MPKIVEECAYDGASEKIDRLGLAPLVNEVRTVLQSFQLLVQEKHNSNSGGVVRVMIDTAFKKSGGWGNIPSGDIDWIKCKIINGTRVCIGVEVQVSVRSDLITRDIVHFQKQIREGSIDVGVLVLPSDRLSYFLTDRAPSMADGKRIILEMRADDLPLLFFAIEHDGTTDLPLPKMRTKQGKEPLE